MTKAPFTGKGERASDLLALIHTDVCGLVNKLARGTSGRKLGLGEVLPQNDIDQSTGKVAEQPQGVVVQSSTQVTQEPRRSGRIHHESEGYGFLVTQGNDVLFIDNDEPTTYAEAVIGPDSEKWLEAMRSEMESMYTNQVWTLVDPPEGGKPIGCRWVFKKKIDMDAYYDYEIWQMDVKTASLNGRLLEDVYMVQPEGFVDPQSAGKVCKLQRSMYGLKQASRSWNLRFDDVIKEFGFIKNEDEPRVYKKVSESAVIFLVLYVSAPYFGPPAPTKDSQPKLRLLFMTRQSEVNARTWEHRLHKRSRVLQKAQKGNQREDKQRTPKQQNPALWHYSSPNYRSVRRYPIWDFKNPSWYQNDQWHLRAHFRSLLLKPRHSRTFADAFLTGLPGRPIHRQVNGTRKQACTHPTTTRTMDQDSDCVSQFILVSRVDPDPGKRCHFLQKDIVGDPFKKSPVHKICANQSQGPQGLGR
ncbi:hypothetical protein CRG98_001114 [Punica granatum]|uniref:Reverse transcriptase Ty1/copia-type domain-containing protein n=1 Tax=Punica granatum TaxID=22663 RepID=A0A2I0LCS4_PUNGR|nr:hypothetical protein CRG98_001114 [Punica granatum]